MTPALRAGGAPAAAGPAVHLPHSREPRGPGGARRAGGGAGAAARAGRDRHRPHRRAPARQPRATSSRRPTREPALPPALLDTARWIAGYYGAPLGLTLRAMLPAADVGRVPGRRGADRAAACRAGWRGMSAPTSTGRAARRRSPAIARALKRPVWDAVNRLARVGAVTLRVEPPETEAAVLTERIAVLGRAGVPPLTEREQLFRRSPAQRALLEALEELGGRAPLRHLLGAARTLAPAASRGWWSAGWSGSRRWRRRATRSATRRHPATADLRRRRRSKRSPRSRRWRRATARCSSGSPAAARRWCTSRRSGAALAPGAGRDRAGAGDRAHAADREPGARRVRRSGRGAAQRALRWRAGRRLARAAARRAPGGGRRPLGGVRAGAGPRGHRGGRGARGQLQERRGAALSRARRRAGPRPARGGAAGAGQRHALARDACTGSGPRLRAGAPPGPGGCAAAAAGRAGGPARRAPGAGGRARCPGPSGSTRSRQRRARPAGAGAAAAQPARVRRHPAVPGVRRGAPVPATAASRSPCTRRPPGCAATTAGTTSRCPRPAPSAAARCSGCAAWAPSSSSASWPRGFPAARLARMDLDTTSAQVVTPGDPRPGRPGEVDILLGTQMIAKGLDFPNVTLVGVVDADTGLHLPDFRAPSGPSSCWPRWRAGRGGGPGAAGWWCRRGIRSTTRCVAAAQHDTEGFLAAELRAAPGAALSAARRAGQSGGVRGIGDPRWPMRAAQVAAWCAGAGADPAAGGRGARVPRPVPSGGSRDGGAGTWCSGARARPSAGSCATPPGGCRHRLRDLRDRGSRPGESLIAPAARTCDRGWLPQEHAHDRGSRHPVPPRRERALQSYKKLGEGAIPQVYDKGLTGRWIRRATALPCRSSTWRGTCAAGGPDS